MLLGIIFFLANMLPRVSEAFSPGTLLLSATGPVFLWQPKSAGGHGALLSQPNRLVDVDKRRNGQGACGTELGSWLTLGT